MAERFKRMLRGAETPEEQALAVGAVISTGLGSSEMMGESLKVGEMTQAMIEYKEGVIVMGLISRDAILALVADQKSNLGNIRYQLKQRTPEIARSL